ncbi:hypothetical protein FMJ29_08405 [Klebsiella michiganensis]|uniref:hypothetical protein n=1 Tax=Klebsiella michiganensis TaxID=1134687 RepID=UPI001CCF5F6F|nr:hypothetical protein [Klebsiella michiganensis]MBZ7458988.1 hypothetical protein [Klebsiella michiganensis]
MSYASSSSLNEVKLYGSYNNRVKQRKDNRRFKTRSKPPVIKINLIESPELSPEEKTTIDEICADGCAFFKPRKSKTAELKAKEPWHFIFPDLHSYQGWLYFNRLTNAMYSGYSVDVLDMTESGAAIL